jgi:hypothetical protein
MLWRVKKTEERMMRELMTRCYGEQKNEQKN